jgi:Protein of unknown function (DUF3800)
MAKEYLIYCDESVEKGEFYSDFYGGVLVSSEDLYAIQQALAKCKLDLNFNGEVKWVKVTENYLDKYKALMDVFFDFIQLGKIKLRIMFRQTAVSATNLSDYNKNHGYFILYYQFIKHAFGLRYSKHPQRLSPTFLRIFFDELPDKQIKAELFKNHIWALQSLSIFTESNIRIRRRDIGEVDSKDHDLLQCLDIVLGAMAFKLNNLNKLIAPETGKRGKRTIAKEKLYKHIHSKIIQIYPHFNIGITTGKANGWTDIWQHPYRHWSFIPRDFTVDETRFKKRQ